MADCNYMEKLEILCGDLVKFIKPWFEYFSLLFLGLSNVC